MANIKNIKDKDGIVYPVTKGDAVSMESGDTLQSELDKKLETVTTNDIQDGAVTSSKIGAGQVTSQNIDWETLENINVESYYSIAHTVGPRSFVTVFGKIGFVNVCFTPTSNLSGNAVITLPSSLGIVPLYTAELLGRIGDGDVRRALITTTNGLTTINIGAHSSSAGKFCTISGMFILA